MTKSLWPSWGVWLFLGICLGTLLHPNHFLDNAACRHLATGNIIAHTHQIPTTDVIGVTPQPWLDYEWGFELVLGVLLQHGLVYPIIFGALLLGSSVYLSWLAILKSSISESSALVLIGFIFLTISLQATLRPLLVTYFCLAWLVYRRQLSLTLSIWDWSLFPIVFLVWTNMHSGWMAGGLYLAANTVGNILDTKKINWSWFLLLLICALFTLINPVGYHLAPTLIEIAHSKHYALWQESAPPSFYPLSWAAIMLVALGCIYSFTLFKKWCWADHLPVWAFYLAACFSQRHLMLLLIVIVPVLVQLFPKGTNTIGTTTKNDYWIGICALLLVLFPLTGLAKPVQSCFIPANVQDLIQQSSYLYKNPITTSGTAGYYVWTFRPWMHDTFDDRGDLYGDTEVVAQLDLENCRGNWKEFLKSRHYDSALIESNLPLNKALENLHWTKVYDEGGISIYWNLTEVKSNQ